MWHSKYVIIIVLVSTYSILTFAEWMNRFLIQTQPGCFSVSTHTSFKLAKQAQSVSRKMFSILSRDKWSLRKSYYSLGLFGHKSLLLLSLPFSLKHSLLPFTSTLLSHQEVFLEDCQSGKLLCHSLIIQAERQLNFQVKLNFLLYVVWKSADFW